MSFIDQQTPRSTCSARGTHIVSSANIKAVRKDVLAKCYGGDITRHLSAKLFNLRTTARGETSQTLQLSSLGCESGSCRSFSGDVSLRVRAALRILHFLHCRDFMARQEEAAAEASSGQKENAGHWQGQCAFRALLAHAL